MTNDSGEELARFFQLLSRDSSLQAQVRACIAADEVALVAQDNGFAVTGAQLLLASGRTEHGVTIARVDHPGEYPGRYY